jgi:hypothetical protein
MVTHHLCHLFVNFLRESEGLAHQVTDADLMRLVRRYDPGAEFEVEFFGGRPKLFIDQHGPREESYPGQSYVIKRGRNGGWRSTRLRAISRAVSLALSFFSRLVSFYTGERLSETDCGGNVRLFGAPSHGSTRRHLSHGAVPGDQETLRRFWGA